MAKERVNNFDAEACESCPHRQRTGESGGVVGRLSKAEGKVAEAVTGDEQYECGLCGCPLVNLSALNVAPDTCPKINEHNERF